jgi:hypothetical protein
VLTGDERRLTVRLRREGFAIRASKPWAEPDARTRRARATGSKLQFAQAWNLLSQVAGDVAGAEVLFCGDLNVDGMAHPDGYRREWQELFDSLGASHFTDELLDAWTREQCPGDPGPGRTPLPKTFDRGMTTHLQRLDYAIRSRGPADGRLLLQHMAIALRHRLRPGDQESVHQRPPARPHRSGSRPAPRERAHRGTDTGHARGAGPRRERTADPGQMHWYRIDERGGYQLEISRGVPRVRLDVYTADNLSVPVAPFSTLDDHANDQPGGTRFALPSAPFYLRVYLADRQSEDRFELRIHRYDGSSMNDAIPLLRGVPEFGQAKIGAPHSVDDPGTPFSEHDAVWFVTPFDTEPDGSLAVTSTVTVEDAATGAFGVLVLGRQPGGPLERLDERPADARASAVATLPTARPRRRQAA